MSGDHRATGGAFLNRLTRRVFWSSPTEATDRPVFGAVAGDQSTIVVDAGNSVAHARTFLDSFSQYSVPPIRYLFFTHAHWDHIFGMQAFPDVVSLAHCETAKRIQKLSQLEWDDQALDERVKKGQEVAYCRDMIRAELPSRAGLETSQPSASFELRMQIDLGDTVCVLEWIGGDHASDASIASTIEFPA